ncbi:MAG: serine/threonine protein kinase [Lachnospiraceae bacterium]|nr:serine/threonine protein kinase [Lachnospiraceae bacterium]
MNEKYPLALPENSVLAGQYIIKKVLGQGGFGITYEAQDYKTGGRVAIKEFFPDSMATRTQTTVIPFTGERGEYYTYGKECFMEEAKTLGKFIGNENIVRIYSYFEENGTAYFVMDFVEGTSFDKYIKQHGGKLSVKETMKILIPVMNALDAVHKAGIIHRDVTPDNIYITDKGEIKLLDFGAARYSLGDQSRSLDVILKHGFAPKEQYARRGRQGPFTDVYTLAATFYFAITGRRPPDSIERLDVDDLVLPSTLGCSISKEEEAALVKALSVQPQDRFRSMGEFKNALIGEKAPAQPSEEKMVTTAAGDETSRTVAAAISSAPSFAWSNENKDQTINNTSGDETVYDRLEKLISGNYIKLLMVLGGLVVLVFLLSGVGKKSNTDIVGFDWGTSSDKILALKQNDGFKMDTYDDYTLIYNDTIKQPYLGIDNAGFYYYDCDGKNNGKVEGKGLYGVVINIPSNDKTTIDRIEQQHKKIFGDTARVESDSNFTREIWERDDIVVIMNYPTSSDVSLSIELIDPDFYYAPATR